MSDIYNPHHVKYVDTQGNSLLTYEQDKYLHWVQGWPLPNVGDKVEFDRDRVGTVLGLVWRPYPAAGPPFTGEPRVDIVIEPDGLSLSK